jgi:hypothetical protein
LPRLSAGPEKVTPGKDKLDAPLSTEDLAPICLFLESLFQDAAGGNDPELTDSPSLCALCDFVVN